MTTKTAIPQTLPLPQVITEEEADDRALQLAAIALVERLTATDDNTDEPGVQALIWNLQNLMRLWDRDTYAIDIRDGVIEFTRSIRRGDWDTGRWTLSWKVETDA